MIWPDNIPDEVVKAARQAWLGSDVNAMEDWRVAIAAALRAWPGRSATGGLDHDGNEYAWVQVPLKLDVSA